MRWWHSIVAAGFIFLLIFFIWALFPEKKEFESLTSMSSGPVAVGSSPMVLISGSEPTDEPWISRSPAARRVRRIFPDTSWMTPEPTLKAGDQITLSLFDDAIFDAKIRNVTVYPNGAVGMTAHLTGDDRGTVYLAYIGQKVRASIEVMGGADYMIRYRSDVAAHYAIEIDREHSVILGCADAALQPLKEALADPLPSAETTSPVAQAEEPSEATMIDVMVVYTPAAASWAAGDPDEDGIESVIALAMQRANETHANSDTRVTLRLVHSAEINYMEAAGSSGYVTDLNYLSGTTDGYMDEVHDWRDEYGVDLVCLLEVTDGTGGYAHVLYNQSGDSSSAFCLVRVQQASWTYTVVHEWGHNMGCHHSKTQASSAGTGLYDYYSSGWQWNDTAAASTDPGSSYYGIDGYCSVMTYEDFDGIAGKEYRRIAYFSNPNVDYTGDSTNPTGDAADGDNARTIRNIRSVIANYREESQDLDMDGLPNDWELQYFGGETNANPSAIASNGMNTVLEAYIAGLDPTNSASVFDVVFTNGFVVRWNATFGRVYSVFGSTNLSESFQALETNILWPQSSWTDTVEKAASFYHVDVQLAE